jgi:hypothetical protein
LTAEVQIKGIAGVNEMIRELKQIEPELYKQLRKDLITDVKPLYQIIKSRIPIQAPLSGMYNNGRLGWGKVVRVTTKINLKKRRGFTSLVSLKTTNAVVEMIDRAGSKNPQGASKSGASMISYLPRLNPPSTSRYIWPAVEKYVPQIIEAANKTLERYSKIKNRNLNFIPKD